MPDINLALILVIENSGLDQQKDFWIVNIFIEANNQVLTLNKAKAISAKLLVVNQKNNLDEKRGKKGRNWKKQEEQRN